VNSYPLWSAVTYLYGLLRRRAGADGESGALSLEWIVIATLLVIAAVAVGAFITTQLSHWEGQVPTGP
jgi:hypothetical protein